MTSTSRALTDRAARLLTLDTEPWLSCEDCFRLMDLYVETVLADPRADVMPQLRVHLAGCPACAEETQALLDLVTADSSEPDTGITGPSA